MAALRGLDPGARPCRSQHVKQRGRGSDYSTPYTPPPGQGAVKQSVKWAVGSGQWAAGRFHSGCTYPG